MEDKGSFRLTARPQDGPKAARLPSHGREIFSLHLSPPSATPRTYDSVYILEEQSRFSFRVTTSSLSRPPPLLESLCSHYDIHLTSVRAPRRTWFTIAARKSRRFRVISDTEEKENTLPLDREGGSTLEVDRNFYPCEIEYASVVYGFTPRGDSRGPDSFLYSYGLSLLSAIPRSRAARLREAHCRSSAVCAEFESSCNKIRALCDGLRYPARARVRLAHIYSQKSEMYTGRLRVYGGYLSPFACPDISVVRCTRATASRPADVNNTTKSLPDIFVFFCVFFFFTFSSNRAPFSRAVARIVRCPSKTQKTIR